MRKIFRKKILCHKHYSGLAEVKLVAADFFKNLFFCREGLVTLLTKNFKITGKKFNANLNCLGVDQLICFFLA